MRYDYFECDCEPDVEYLDAKVENRRKERGADHLSAIYDMISGQKPINVSDLYFHLEEVGSSLDFDIPYEATHEDYTHSLLL